MEQLLTKLRYNYKSRAATFLSQVKMRWERKKSLQLRRSRTDSTFFKTHEERLNERLTEKENELLIPITQARVEPMQLDILLKSECVRETEKERKERVWPLSRYHHEIIQIIKS